MVTSCSLIAEGAEGREEDEDEDEDEDEEEDEEEEDEAEDACVPAKSNRLVTIDGASSR